MKKRIAIVAALFIAAVFAVIAVKAEEPKAAETAKLIDDKEGLFANIQLLSDSITLISADYVEEKKVKDIIYGAIKGMMGTLDDYSQFLDPEGFKEITEETKGEFGGVGIEIGFRDGLLTVITPIEDTPAFQAGVQAGDKVVKLDGKLTRDMTLDDAVKKLRGNIGEKITITVLREGADKLLDFTLTRAVIKLKSITEAKIIEGNVGYIKISEFQQRTGPDLKEAIKRLKAEGAKNLIMDVRNNPGGLLDAAVDAAELFLPQGAMIVYTEGRDPKNRMEFKAKKRTDLDDMALVVLANKGSASAAEIFAGAIKDNKRGIVIGEQTFGKGSVQTVIPLKDGSALRLTTAAYFTPSGKNLMHKGLDPDILVEKKKLVAAKDEFLNDEEMARDRVFDKIEETDAGVTDVKGKDEGRKDEGRGKRDEGRKDEGRKDEGRGKKGAETKGSKKPEEYDNQLAAALNVLKGLRIFEGYKQTHPTENGSGAYTSGVYTSGVYTSEAER